MKYNQQFLDELCQRIPYMFWKDLEKAINKGKQKKNRIPMSTIQDSLRVYRDNKGGKGNGRGRTVSIDKVAIIEKAIELLESKGIQAPELNN